MDRRIAGLLCVQCLLMMTTPAPAAATEDVFGVRVYIDGEPTCTGQGRFAATKVTISSFETALSIDTIVGEVARRAREHGADIVYNMRIISYQPGEGAEVSALAGTCMSASQGENWVNAIQQIRSAEHGQMGALQYPIGRPSEARLLDERTLSSAELELVKIVLRQVLTSTASVTSSCPFVPDRATIMRGGHKIWLLQSSQCDDILLVNDVQQLRDGTRLPLTADQMQILAIALRDTSH